MYRLQRFRLFVDNQDLKIIDELKVAHGIKLTVTDNTNTSFCTFFVNGNVLIQGKDSTLRNLLMLWAGKIITNYEGEDSFLGYGDFPAGWREWNENADWLQQYIEENGEPAENQAPDEYKIQREVLFHDYMFRNKLFAEVSFITLRFVIKNWLDRFCYMGHDPDEVVDDIIGYAKRLWSDDVVDSLSFGQIADAISSVLCERCTQKFVKSATMGFICPQVKDDQNMCAYALIDAIYPFSSANEVIAYTKTNMRKLIKRENNLTWYELKLTSPLETIMAEGLKTAGLLYVPQWQAHDDQHKYKIDFVVKTSKGPYVAIECDGLEFHAKPQMYIRDRIRDRYLQQRGFYVMRFSSVEIFNNLDTCLQEIDEAFWHIQKGKLSLTNPPRNSYFGVND